MSFLTRTVPLTTRATFPPSLQAYRCFSTTLRAQKGPIETTRDTLKKADRTVADAAVKGIEKGQEVTQKAKETVGITGKEAEGKAKEVTGEAKGKASELEGKAKGKFEEVKGKAQS